ncbi:MSC_0882 family membrane protein [Mesoplasma seiffertii]|uniref:MSC_0882 family membrane protein n=1 Tax=Mesoplasma seiffertii TaxID=28224 RepID=UPI000685BCFF|nr:hypothetical protein [Mesoplasma seiffertii]
MDNSLQEFDITSNQQPNPSLARSNSLRGRYKQNEHVRELTPNFTKKELDAVEIPNEIAKEIRLEKYRIFGINIMGLVCSLVAAFFITLSMTQKDGTNFLNIADEYIPSPVGMFFLLGFGVFCLMIAFVDYRHIILDVKRYKTDILMGKEKIPHFLIRNYKSLVTRPYYVNWIAFSVYFFGGIIIGIMYAIKAATKNNQKPLEMNTEIIIMICLLVITLIIQALSLVFTRLRKGNIDVYYGYDIVPFEETKELRKRANRTCLIIFFGFLAVILCFVIIPMMIIRKRSGKKIVPFI